MNDNGMKVSEYIFQHPTVSWSDETGTIGTWGYFFFHLLAGMIILDMRP